MNDPCYCDLRPARPHTWNPRFCPAPPLMFKRQRRAVQGMWDVLSDILETPGIKLPRDMKRRALKAIAEAQHVFPGEA